MNVSEWLQQLQGDRSQSEFARELGVSQSVLSRLYLGKRRFGPKLARQLKRAYPHLALEIAAFLLPADMPDKHVDAA